MQSDHLKSLIEGAALLAGSSRSEGASNMEDVLRSRLAQYYTFANRQDNPSPLHTLDDVQATTARESLRVLEQIQLHLVGNLHAEQRPENAAEQELLGTRDLGYIRTLLSLVFQWAVGPWLGRVCASIPTTTPSARRHIEVRVIDLTTVPEDFQHLKDTIFRLFHLILPTGIHGPPNATILSSVILDKYLSDLLKPSLVLGWLPKSLASESVSPINNLRPMVVRLMHMLPVSKCIAALSAILADASCLPYVRKSCSYLMGRQLLRKDGVRGLLLALFSDDDVSEENAPLEKLESVGRVLRTIPAGMSGPEYFEIILPQLLSLLSTSFDVPAIQRRVAAFTLSQLLSSEENTHHADVSRILLPLLQKPLLETSEHCLLSQDDTPKPQSTFSPLESLDILQTFLANTDPSPTLISGIMTPVIPAIYTVSYSLDKIKSADPSLKATLSGLLETWGRLIGDTEGVATLWLIVDGEGGEWQVDIAGEIRRVESSGNDGSLSLFTPQDLKRAAESGEFDLDANILGLRPDPAYFAGFLKSLDRPEIASEIFVRVLDAYRESKDAGDTDPLRTLLYLQLVVQLQAQLSNGDSSVNILKKPDQILSFIKHALETSQRRSNERSVIRQKRGDGLALEDLRIIEEGEDEEENSDGGDSDDEDASDNLATSSEDMTSTAVNLLLSVLEANPDLSTENAPTLDEIFTLLDKLARADASTEAIKMLAREARMVLIARLASSSAMSSSSKLKSTKEESPTDTYQKALKLLQDPLLPVRAHGLLLLRQLVSSRGLTKPGGPVSEPTVDRALIPGILSIFLQSLQDDDSYIFLNAVQGLAAMVDGFGKDVLKGLVGLYAKGLDGIGASTMTKQDVDTRTRIGEALGQVIRRCGDALPKYIDEIAPSLVAVMRSSHLPTALRTSSIALLAQCVNTSPLAVLPWATDLFSAMIDLLQLESVQVDQTTQPKSPLTSTPALAPAADEVELSMTKNPKTDSTDFKPTTKDSKIPILRRSALHLLSLLTRAFASQLDDSGGSARLVYVLPGELMRRAKTTVGYVASTDHDGVTRVMAKETAEGLDAFAEAMLGL
ncbi:hypothetical protein BDY19DRAFT_983564 [Irpex rosettiformis]|uniref:Uncharacterized protein n=1 Tax=Irpex rosettiformis TaxID=378272 RepID=A0ACB8UCW6_9APHY|nr:hypothetical protein BDY19DRAFT_983564 [Irpex rosettiformis]